MNKFYGYQAEQNWPGTPLFKTSSPFIDVVMRRPQNAPSSEGARQHVTMSALIDTGASHSCIDKSLVERLHLVRTGEEQLTGVGGTVDANVYQVVLDIPSLKYRQTRLLASPLEQEVPAMVLLGRDFLSDFIVHYDGPERCFYFFRAGQEFHPYQDGDE